MEVSPVRRAVKTYFVSPSNWIVLDNGSHFVKWPTNPMNLPSGSLNVAIQNRDPLDVAKKEYTQMPTSIVYDTNTHSHAMEQMNRYTDDSDHNPCPSPPPPLPPVPPLYIQSSPNNHLRHTRSSNGNPQIVAQRRLPFNPPPLESGISPIIGQHEVMPAEEFQGNFQYSLGNSYFKLLFVCYCLLHILSFQ
jgi:hypothetical protein